MGKSVGANANAPGALNMLLDDAIRLTAWLAGCFGRGAAIVWL